MKNLNEKELEKQQIIIDRILVICEKIQKMIDSGMTLAQINKKSYFLRESGEDMIYLPWLNKDQGSKSCLTVQPISKQREYDNFFKIVIDGFNVLRKYSLFVYSDRVEFLEKTCTSSENKSFTTRKLNTY